MYYNIGIKEYEPSDVPSLKRLWIETFGDEESLVDKFFELLSSFGTGLVAKADGELLGAAYILKSELWLKNGQKMTLGYIYAVAVDKAARSNGIGARLTRACIRYCREHDIDLCTTLPAEPSLYDWYGSISGLSCVSYIKEVTVKASIDELEIKELQADEYGFKRNDLLRGKDYVNFYYGWLLFNEALCKTYGGGLFGYKNDIACGYVDGETLYIKEHLGESESFIPALCNKLGAKRAVVRCAAKDGERYICACEGDRFPADTVWNLSLD